MTEYERCSLWQFEKIYDLSDSASVVRNAVTGQYMVYHVSAAENFPVMSRISMLNHRNLMRVYDVALNGGYCVSLCEYLGGTTLEAAVNTRGAFGERDAVRIMTQVCEALSALHANGIVHRDVNPSNVMLTSDGTVKLIDFDITRVSNPNAPKDTRILGTLGYASPEQFGFAQTDARSDVYSCGVLLNYLLTGRQPNETLCAGKLQPVVLRCIEIDRAKRFDSAAQLEAALKKPRLAKYPFTPKKRIAFKIVSGILSPVYLLAVGLYINSWFDPRNLTSPEKIVNHVIFGATLLLFWTLLPYIFFCDAFSMSYRIRPNNHAGGRAITVFLGIASIVIGFVILGIFWDTGAR